MIFFSKIITNITKIDRGSAMNRPKSLLGTIKIFVISRFTNLSQNPGY